MKRVIGRPTRRWGDNIETVVKEVRWKGDDWGKDTLDKDRKQVVYL
jgi:hypothetical protein